MLFGWRRTKRNGRGDGADNFHSGRNGQNEKVGAEVTVEIHRPDPKKELFEIRFHRQQLTHAASDRLLPFERQDVFGRHLRLNLGGVSWVDPFGLVYLDLYVRRLLEWEPELLEIIISKNDVGNYLTRMSFAEEVGRHESVRVRSPTLWFRRGEIGSLIELERLALGNDDEVDAAVQRLLEVVYSSRSHVAVAQEPLQQALTEILGNVEVHSRHSTNQTAEAIVAAQAYRNGVKLAIGDAGIGIPTRLKRNGAVAHSLDDIHALERALEPGVTTRIGRGGMGLTIVSQQVEEDGGHLAIRSGRAHLVVLQKKRTRKGRCHALPGTIVQIHIPGS